MLDTENHQTPSSDKAEWGPDMDAPAHIQGYKNFLRVVIATGAGAALVLILMGLFLT